MVKLKAFLIDFDGTIVLSEESRLYSINKVLENYNVEISNSQWDNEYKRWNTREILKDISSQNNLDLDIEKCYGDSKKIRDDYIDKNGISVVKGFFEFVEYIKSKNLKVIICSGGNREHIEKVMKISGIENIEFIGREDYENEKPYPDCYIRGMEYLGIKSNNCAVIDDSYNGLIAGIKSGAARIIGMNCSNESGIEELPISQQVEDFTQIDFDNLR